VPPWISGSYSGERRTWAGGRPRGSP
jgi:hypothetical protein